MGTNAMVSDPVSPSSSAQGIIEPILVADKTRGFDPAAAPMATDSEAGRAASSEPSLANGREPTQAPENENATSYGTAMRSNGHDKQEWPAIVFYITTIVGVAL